MKRSQLTSPFCLAVISLASVTSWCPAATAQDTTAPLPAAPAADAASAVQAEPAIPVIPATPGTPALPAVPAVPGVPTTPAIPVQPEISRVFEVPRTFGLAHAGAIPPVWLGIGCVPVDGALKAQLKLDHGVVVTLVAKGSPAEAAGLKVDDIVLSLDEQPVHELGDFLKPLADGTDEAVSLEILRAGDQQTVQIVPGPRPQAALVPAQDNPNMEEKELRFWNAAPGTPSRFTVVSPGIVFGKQAPEVPGDVTLKITKHGDQPAQIEIKRGDESWDVDAEHLDELPEDMRAWVKPMLGARDVLQFMPAKPHKAVFQSAPHGPGHPVQEERIIIKSAPDQSASVVARVEAAAKPSSVDERLDSIAEQLEALTKAVKELQTDRQ